MMNSAEIESYAHSLISELIGKHKGYEEAMSWGFRWNRRVRAAGLCNYNKKTIELSFKWAKTLPFEELDDTIRHEIAHALAGSLAGHGPEWKRWAVAVGAKPERLLDEKLSTEHSPDPKYVMVEPNGEIVKRYYRRPNKTTLAKVKVTWVRGRKNETKGKLKIVRYGTGNLYEKRCLSEGSVASAPTERGGAKYLVVDPDGNIVKRYYRRPNRKTILNIPNMYVRGRKEETLGCLRLITA